MSEIRFIRGYLTAVEQLRSGGWKDQEKRDRSGSYWMPEAFQ